MIDISKKSKNANGKDVIEIDASKLKYNPKTMFFTRDEFHDYTDSNGQKMYCNEYLTLNEPDYIEYSKQVDNKLWNGKTDYAFLARRLSDAACSNFKLKSFDEERRMKPRDRALYEEQEWIYLETMNARRKADEIASEAKYDDMYIGFSTSAYENDARDKAIAYIDGGNWTPVNPITAATAAGLLDFEKAMSISNTANNLWNSINYLLTHTMVAGKPNPRRISSIYDLYLNLIDLVAYPVEPDYLNNDPDLLTSKQQAGINKWNHDYDAAYKLLNDARFDTSSPLHQLTADLALLRLANKSDNFIDEALETGWIQKLNISSSKTTTYLQYYAQDAWMVNYPAYDYITKNLKD